MARIHGLAARLIAAYLVYSAWRALMRITDPGYPDEPCPARGVGLTHSINDEGRCNECGRTILERGGDGAATTDLAPDAPPRSDAGRRGRRPAGPPDRMVRSGEAAVDAMDGEIPLGDDPPTPGRCMADGGHPAKAVWRLPRDGTTWCARHLLDVMQRATWPRPIRRID